MGDDEAPAEVPPRLAVLTDAQRELVLSRIAEARRIFAKAVRDRGALDSFHRATSWAFKVFAFDVTEQDEFAPEVSYGAAFGSIVGYVIRRRIDAEAEEEEPRY